MNDECIFKCDECDGRDDVCTICAGNRIDLPNCSCPSGTYEDNISATCPSCNYPCSEC